MTLAASRLFAQATSRLSQHGVPDALTSAKYLMAAALESRSLDVADKAITKHVSLTQQQADKFAMLIERREAREPLQYIIGDWDFDCLSNLKVRAPVLIPRPETEELVGLASRYVEAAQEQRKSLQLPQPFSFLEVGPGSGAVSISLLKRYPGAVGTAIDISKEAVDLTRENADRQGVASRLSVIHADALTYVPQQAHIPVLASTAIDAASGSTSAGRTDALANTMRFDISPLSSAPRFDMLISNPPYIPESELTAPPEAGGLQPEVSKWEDPRALKGGDPAGLGFTLQMLSAAVKNKWLRPQCPILLEVHPFHLYLLAALLKKTLPLPAEEMQSLHGQTCAIDSEGGSSPLQRNNPVARWLAIPTHKRDTEWLLDATGLSSDVFKAAKENIAATIAPEMYFVSGFTDFTGRPRFVHLRSGQSLEDEADDAGIGILELAVFGLVFDIF